jgi:hypothetical protein
MSFRVVVMVAKSSPSLAFTGYFSAVRIYTRYSKPRGA